MRKLRLSLKHTMNLAMLAVIWGTIVAKVALAIPDSVMAPLIATHAAVAHAVTLLKGNRSEDEIAGITLSAFIFLSAMYWLLSQADGAWVLPVMATSGAAMIYCGTMSVNRERNKKSTNNGRDYLCQKKRCGCADHQHNVDSVG